MYGFLSGAFPCGCAHIKLAGFEAGHVRRGVMCFRLLVGVWPMLVGAAVGVVRAKSEQ